MRFSSMRQALVFSISLLLVTAPQASEAPEVESGGCIPYGANWSFMVAAPPGWSSACPAVETHGVTVAMWPSDSNWKDAHSVMYANPSAGLDPRPTLVAFADNEINEFK